MSTPGVVVAAADADAVARGDVRRRRPVELAGARAVADLPDAEQLRQAAAVAALQRCGDGVVGVRQRAHDPSARACTRRTASTSPLWACSHSWSSRRDAVAEDVHGLRLAAEVRGQLLGDEHVGPVGDLEDARDRVVVGDRHEVHAAALGQLVDLLRRRRALGQPDGALHAELGLLRRGRVAVHVDPARRSQREAS